MNIGVKFGIALSALFLLAACETPPGEDGGAGGAGGAYGEGLPTGPGSEGEFVNNVGDRVFFAYDSSVLTSEGQATLERQAAWLKQYGNVNVTLEGHCDERGTREYNLALGERRANSARNYLVSLGIPDSRITTVSYGKERPAVVGSNEAAWAQNRRSVTVIAR